MNLKQTLHINHHARPTSRQQWFVLYVECLWNWWETVQARQYWFVFRSAKMTLFDVIVRCHHHHNVCILKMPSYLITGHISFDTKPKFHNCVFSCVPHNSNIVLETAYVNIIARKGLPFTNIKISARLWESQSKCSLSHAPLFSLLQAPIHSTTSAPTPTRKLRQEKIVHAFL